jgi:hypothetical protein
MFRTPSLVAVALVCLLGLSVAWVREIDRAHSVGQSSGRRGAQTERCLTCHFKSEEDPGGVHARAALGCASCHLGNPLAFEKARAHEGLVREAGELSTVALTCGKEGCHAREAARVSSSLMARASGIVAVDRWVFGEISSPDSTQTISEALAAAHATPGEIHLRKLCGGCHLGTRRGNRDDAIVGNGSGCAACHAPLHRSGDAARPHPPIDARVSDDRCFGCHSRSGRISLSYEGLAEIEKQQVERAASPCVTQTTLLDGRSACRHEADVHRVAGMSCTDCHLHSELMGDGTLYVHQEEQVEVTCESCHGPVDGSSETTWGRIDDPITRDLLRLRGESRPPNERVRLGRRGTPLWNLRPSASEWTLVKKLDGKSRPVVQTPPDANHRMKGHARLSCSACHAASAPTCSTCHTRFEPGGEQWDFGAGGPTRGAWIEGSEGFGSAPPGLGVRADGAIGPAIPGMILDIDGGPGSGGVSSHRFFAPIEPHTTAQKARTCEGCHRSPAALGLGSGQLDFAGREPAFSPEKAVVGDPALAADAWIRLFPEKPGVGTRTGFRSLNAAEQRRVLSVGVCLPCHSKAADPIWRDFGRSMERFANRSDCPFRRAAPRWVLR